MSEYTEAAQQAHKDYAEHLKPVGARDFVLGMDYVHAMLHHFMEDLPETSERRKAFHSMVARLTGERGRIAVAKAGDLLPSGIAGKVDTARFPGKPDAWQLNLDVPEPTAAKEKKASVLVVTEYTEALGVTANGPGAPHIETLEDSFHITLPDNGIVSLTWDGATHSALVHEDHPGEAAIWGAVENYANDEGTYKNWSTPAVITTCTWTELTMEHLPLQVLYIDHWPMAAD